MLFPGRQDGKVAGLGGEEWLQLPVFALLTIMLMCTDVDCRVNSASFGALPECMAGCCQPLPVVSLTPIAVIDCPLQHDLSVDRLCAQFVTAITAVKMSSLGQDVPSQHQKSDGL